MVKNMHRSHKINEKRLRRIHLIWADVARMYIKAGKEAILARGDTSNSTTAARKAVIFIRRDGLHLSVHP